MKIKTLFLAGICLSLALWPSKAHSQEASESATPGLDDITENVRKRIQDVVKDKTLLNTGKEIAYIGTLQSLTNNTLSILTDTGARLASTSANTTVIRIPGSKAIALADLSIDGYLSAVGIPATDQVLETTTVIAQDAPPQAATDKTFFGSINTYDTDTNLLSLTNPSSNERVTVLVGRKTGFNQWVADGTKTALKRTKDLVAGTPAIIIYSPGAAPDGGDLALDVLLNLSPSPTTAP